MVSIKTKIRFALVALAAIAVSGPLALAQPPPHTPEFFPRPGEARLNALQFKASHNSYMRDETYAAQLDDWNCWSLSLDVCWNGSAVYVNHCTGSDCDGNSESCGNGDTLHRELMDIMGSQTLSKKFTIIWLEVVCTDDIPNLGDFRNLVMGDFESTFGLGQCYQPSEFKDPNGDDGRWPSWRELVRRGKHYCVVLEKGTDPMDPTFFDITYSAPNGPPATPTAEAFYNHEHGDNPMAPSAYGDYWISSGYPDPCCGSTGGPLLETEGEFSDMVDDGDRLVGTNCISNDFTNEHWGLHAPQPLYVNFSSTGNPEYGTLGNPYWGVGNSFGGLLEALQRAHDKVEVSVESGDYDVLAQPLIINHSMVLNARNGTAMIR